MKVLFCKIICFCKSSSQIYTPGSLRLENTPPTLQEHRHQQPQPQPQPLQQPLPQPQKQKPLFCKDEADAAAKNKDNISKKQKLVVNQSEDHCNCTSIASGLQSSLRKSSSQNSEPAAATAQKKVQWLDFLGKELAQIREFESSEADDTEYEGVKSRSCVCSIQ